MLGVLPQSLIMQICLCVTVACMVAKVKQKLE